MPNCATWAFNSSDSLLNATEESSQYELQTMWIVEYDTF